MCLLSAGVFIATLSVVNAQNEWIYAHIFLNCCSWVIYCSVLVVVGVITTIIAYCVCKNRGKRKVASKEQPPHWTYTVQTDSMGPAVGFDYSLCSDGITIQPDGTSIVRTYNQPIKRTHGVLVGKPLTEGKHVFEFIWPTNQRGYNACLGVATKDAPLDSQGLVSLVGHTDLSWGWDMVRRRTIREGKVQSTYPSAALNTAIPDKVLMYVNTDTCTVAFGTDGGVYWGLAFTYQKTGHTLYPMVSVNHPMGLVRMRYLGKASLGPYPGPAGLNTGQQMPLASGGYQGQTYPGTYPATLKPEHLPIAAVSQTAGGAQCDLPPYNHTVPSEQILYGAEAPPSYEAVQEQDDIDRQNNGGETRDADGRSSDLYNGMSTTTPGYSQAGPQTTSTASAPPTGHGQ
ncbi:uncharacterized protein LOC106171413 [Lingula anatina]|uniref:Uncharacterized protein LOC106171413 n=1 Tax=Lingula anatina TaxID=7574 RepID=A0A1S3JAI2_LINAN|nr:uncharacterized protein LOC106171413 [Lingula anatina]|eukprot:XP_013407206.1 uncharacterized protein LOC106171413 [Lingula anatina]